MFWHTMQTVRASGNEGEIMHSPHIRKERVNPKCDLFLKHFCFFNKMLIIFGMVAALFTLLD